MPLQASTERNELGQRRKERRTSSNPKVQNKTPRTFGKIK